MHFVKPLTALADEIVMSHFRRLRHALQTCLEIIIRKEECVISERSREIGPGKKALRRTVERNESMETIT